MIIIKKIKNSTGSTSYRKYKPSGSGFVILFAVTLASLFLTIALGISKIAFKEVAFSTDIFGANEAFFAADSGIEKALFDDKAGTICNPDPSAPCSTSFTIYNLGGRGTTSSPMDDCVKVTVTKTVAPNLTTVVAKGYNLGGTTAACTSSNPHRVEREIRVAY
jgi:hypothetical protein